MSTYIGAKVVEISATVVIKRTGKDTVQVIYQTGDGQMLREEEVQLGVNCTLTLSGLYAKVTLSY